MKTKIKICGITNVEDAQAAVASGADYIGLIFAPSSRRKLDVKNASTIIEAIKKQAVVVGVFQNQPYRIVNELASSLNLDLVQLHGIETPEYCSLIKTPVIKALELTDQLSIGTVLPFIPVVRYLLFDRPKYHDGSLYHFSCAKKFLPAMTKVSIPFFFAGGLNSSNVRSIISNFHPHAVDVASGVEISPAKKDHKELEKFCRAADMEAANEY